MLRTFVISGIAWAGGVALVLASRGTVVGELTSQELVACFVLGLAAYFWELQARRAFWTVAWPPVGEGEFAKRIRALQDAAPLVELCAPGQEPDQYKIAEWQDETRHAEKDSFEGAPVGLFLVTFPLVLIPGDRAEAAALDHARLQAGSQSQSGCAYNEYDSLRGGSDADKVAVRMRLRWPDGLETDVPTPEILADGSAANMLRPLLWLCVISLLGLFADLLLPFALSNLEWPIRKRIFTMRGGPVGAIQFELRPEGVVVSGDEQQLRQSNAFWFTANMWTDVWATAREFAPRLESMRSLRRNCLVAAATFALAAAVAVMAAAVVVPGLRLAAALGGAGSLCCLAMAGAAGCFMERLNASFADDVRTRFPSLVCSVSWSQQSGDAGMFKSNTLMLTVAQRPRLGAEAPPNAYVTTAAPASTFAGML